MKAQVKLRFNNTRREKMLVERRLQVTKKKTASGLSMKTLEGTISYADQENVDRKVRLASSFPYCSLLSSMEPFHRISRLRLSTHRTVIADVSALVSPLVSLRRNDKRFQRNVLLSTKKSLRNWESRKLSSRTSFSVIKKSQTGLCPNLLRSRRSLTTFSKRASEPKSSISLTV